MINWTSKTLIGIAITAIACTGCSARTSESTVIQLTDERAKALEFLNKIEQANSETPRVFSAKFVIEGVSPKNKKFKTLGEITFDRNAELFKVSFVDSIFKSPMAIVARDGRKIKLYMPVEKTLYEDDTYFINLKNYIDVNIEFDVLADVATWHIPIIKGYTVKQSVLQKTSTPGTDKENYIVLENDLYFETISVKNDLPNKVLIINKANKEKTEFYFENPERKNNVLYYKTIRYISAQRGERISVKFTSISPNSQLSKDRDFSLKVPSATKVVRVN